MKFPDKHSYHFTEEQRQSFLRFPRYIKKDHVDKFLTNQESIDFSKAEYMDNDAAQMLLGYEHLFVDKNIISFTECIEKAKSIGLSYMCLANIGFLTADLMNNTYDLENILERKIFDRRKLIGVRCMVNYKFIGTVIDIEGHKFFVHFDDEFIGVGNQKFKTARIIWPSYFYLDDRLYESIISAPDDIDSMMLEMQSRAESMHEEMLIDEILRFEKTHTNACLHNDEHDAGETDLLSQELGGENDNFARSEEDGWFYPEKD